MWIFQVKNSNATNKKQTGLTGLLAIGELTADESLKTMKELELGLSEELFEECCASGDSL